MHGGIKRSLFFISLCFIMALSAQLAAQSLNPENIEARRLRLNRSFFEALGALDLEKMSVLRDQGADANIRPDRLGLKASNIFSPLLPIFKARFDSSGWPILTWAVYLGDEAAVRLLLRAGAHVNAPDEYGATALHWAAWAGRVDIAKILMTAGAGCTAEDLQGRRPKDWAVMMGRAELILLLDGRDCRAAPFADADRDGIPDAQDACPNTPFGAEADERGCWVVATPIFFEPGRTEVKERFIPALVRTARVIEKYPSLKFDVVGHSDATRDVKLAHSLALARAEAVRDILVKAGVSADRLKAVSRGADEPLPGALAGGLSRRVELAF